MTDLKDASTKKQIEDIVTQMHSHLQTLCENLAAAKRMESQTVESHMKTTRDLYAFYLGALRGFWQAAYPQKPFPETIK